jgi:hypothetical protein
MTNDLNAMIPILAGAVVALFVLVIGLGVLLLTRPERPIAHPLRYQGKPYDGTDTRDAAVVVPVVNDDDENDAPAELPPVLVRVDGRDVRIPDPVVASCLGEARGNMALLSRIMQAAGERLAAGEAEADVLRAVQRGEHVEA